MLAGSPSHKCRLVGICVISFLLLIFSVNTGRSSSRSAEVKAAFGPECKAVILETLKDADKEVLVCIFNFTLKEIADELIRKHKKGLSVRVKLDARQVDPDYSQPVVDKLKKAGIEVILVKMPEHTHMHHKFIVVDKLYVVTGSYNFTYSATVKNWENCVLVKSRTIAKEFRNAWLKVKDRKKDE